MTQEALIRRLQTSCLGLDPIDPLRLLVDDVIEALEQTQEPWCMKMNGCKTKCKDCPDEPPQRTEQEPFEDLATELFVVAQISPADDGFSDTIERIESWLREHFSTPPQRTWVGLTDDDVMEVWDKIKNGDWAIDFYDVIEAKLKQKNGYAEEKNT